MEHAYTATFTPMDTVSISASLQQVNYRDYFHHVTTSALSLTNGILDPNEEVLSIGGSVGYSGIKGLAVAADYKHYDYDIQGNAHYWGAKASYTTPTLFSAGLSFHRMDGSSERLEYNQYRVYLSQKMGPADVTLDFYDVDFDSRINGRKNTYSVAAAAGYDLPMGVRVAADIDFLRSTDMDHELRGLIKVVYAFDSERRAK
jgi:hypothetical protein